MSEVKVISSTVQIIGNIHHEHGGLAVGKTEHGNFAWSIESNTFEKWELIPKSLYFELVDFNRGKCVYQR